MTNPNPEDIGEYPLVTPGSGTVDKPVPPGASDISAVPDLQNWTVERYKRHIGAPIRQAYGNAHDAIVDAVISNVVDGIYNAFIGNPSEEFQPVYDGQLELVNRLDLLDGVRGYCSAYQSLNINAALSLGNNRRRDLPFGSPYGPSRGAHVDAAKGGIVFDEPGLWTVHCMIHARKTDFVAGGFGEPDAAAMYVRIHQPNGVIDTETIVDAYSYNSSDSITATLPFVIPEPGYYVTIGCWTSRWRWWDGGTRYTRLSVVKSDNRAIEPGAPTVPDEAS